MAESRATRGSDEQAKTQHIITRYLGAERRELIIHDLPSIENLAGGVRGVPMSKQSPISGLRKGNIDRVMEEFNLASVSTLCRPGVIMIGDGKL